MKNKTEGPIIKGASQVHQTNDVYWHQYSKVMRMTTLRLWEWGLWGVLV